MLICQCVNQDCEHCAGCCGCATSRYLCDDCEKDYLDSLQAPTIHPNGTSKERLIGELCGASAALDAAFDALKQTGPNVRDYAPEEIEAAEQQHLDRLRRLDSVKAEIDHLTRMIDEE